MRKNLPGSGFTIIEIMIVLAIAGLIMLIVFLAVPALQRTARNNERKHDASFLATQRQQYDIDHNTVVRADAATCPGGSPDFANFCDYIAKGMSYYQESAITIINYGFSAPATVPTVTPDTIITATHLRCNNTHTAAVTANTSDHDMVVLYALEGSGGAQVDQCLESGVY